MQTLTEIRELLARAGLRPHKPLGQNFLIDQNLLRKVLELAELTGQEAVLEVGPGTGTLTEELVTRAKFVVAAEIDRGLAELLCERLGSVENVLVLGADALAGKHAINPEVHGPLPTTIHLVSNLPYSIATPLLAQCLVDSWRVLRAREDNTGLRLFERMTFTVQSEMADRLAARPGTKQYGPVSVIVALLGRISLGPIAPAEAFWPRPNVASRIARIDFDPEAAERLTDVDTLSTVLSLAFGHRRKQLAAMLRRRDLPFQADRLASALADAGVEKTARAEEVEPERFFDVVSSLTKT